MGVMALMLARNVTRMWNVRMCSSLGSMWNVPAVDKIGPIPLGGQVKKGPFFAGDAMYPAKLPPPAASTGVVEALASLEERAPQLTALRGDGLSWTFAECKMHSDAIARGLAELGAKKGDTIGVSGSDAASALSVIAADQLDLKVAVEADVPAGAVRTAGTYPLADISVYGGAPVGGEGRSVQAVISGAPG